MQTALISLGALSGGPALLLSWALLAAAAEVVLAHSPGSALGAGLALVCAASAAAIVSGMDFFGVTLLAAYSSVFLLLTLILLHVGRAWAFFAPRGRALWALLGLAYLALVSSPALPQPALSPYSPHYAQVGRLASPVGLVHGLLVSVGAWESTLANVYILLGLVAGVALLGSRLGPGHRPTPPTPLRSRRSWRRRHSTQVR